MEELIVHAMLKQSGDYRRLQSFYDASYVGGNIQLHSNLVIFEVEKLGMLVNCSSICGGRVDILGFRPAN